jgi:peptide alpha-N-acetyltransferase
MADEDEGKGKGRATDLPAELRYLQYDHALEKQYLPSIRALMSRELSEPYSIYVYRYFLYQWGDLCFIVRPSFSLPTQCKLTTNSL